MERIPKIVNVAIQNFVNRVTEKLGNRVKKIVLYGSYARGDFNVNSDIDIMILTDLSDEEMDDFRDDVIGISYDIEWENEFNITISPLVKNIDKFNYWLEALPFYMNVQKEGVVLSESKNI